MTSNSLPIPFGLSSRSLLASLLLGTGLLLIVVIFADWWHPKDLRYYLWHHAPWHDRKVAWPTADPASEGMSKQDLEALRMSLAHNSTVALLVLRRGRIVEEWYAEEFHRNALHYTASLAKALVGSLSLAIAVDEELVDLDTPASRYLSTWRDDSLKSRVTLRQLGSHMSGLAGALYPGHEHMKADWRQAYWQHRQKRINLAVNSAPITSVPGTNYAYSDPAFDVLALVIAKRLDDKLNTTIRRAYHDRLMKPLGVDASAYYLSYGEAYRYDKVAVHIIAGGAEFTARAAARMGQLVANGGNWNGRRLLSLRTVRSVVTTTANAALLPPGIPTPGLGWWTNESGTWPDLPRDTYVGAGYNHQLVVAIPSAELVAVRFGGNLSEASYGGLDSTYWEAAYEHFLRPVVKAIEGY